MVVVVVSFLLFLLSISLFDNVSLKFRLSLFDDDDVFTVNVFDVDDIVVVVVLSMFSI